MFGQFMKIQTIFKKDVESKCYKINNESGMKTFSIGCRHEDCSIPFMRCHQKNPYVKLQKFKYKY